MANTHYLSRYNRFIDSLRSQVIDGYCEEHHIVPRSHGGSDAKDNLIALTPRQHFVAHWMLWKAYGGNMGRAFFMMSNFGKYGKVNSRTYAMAREDYSEQVKKQLALKPNSYVATAETRQKMREKKLGKKLSPEHIEKVRQSRIGKPLSDEWKANLSKAKKGIATRGTGWSQSEETKRKIGEAQVGVLNHRYGKKHTMETRLKMKLAHQRPLKQINADESQLQDADGNLMTAEQAKAFVKELP